MVPIVLAVDFVLCTLLGLLAFLGAVVARFVAPDSDLSDRLIAYFVDLLTVAVVAAIVVTVLNQLGVITLSEAIGTNGLYQT